eukprot:5263775-Pyramimonas_sp.AAC.1
MPPSYLASVAFRLNPKPVFTVSSWYSAWARGVERTICAHHCAPLPAGPSRGDGCKFVVEE